jgi:hypothetical protein
VSAQRGSKASGTQPAASSKRNISEGSRQQLSMQVITLSGTAPAGARWRMLLATSFDALRTLTGARAKAWCLLLHAEAYHALPLSRTSNPGFLISLVPSEVASNTREALATGRRDARPYDVRLPDRLRL